MKIIAYAYSDPLLDSPADATIWGWDIEQIYHDLGQRQQWQKLINDCQKDPPNYLLIRKLDDLGENLTEIMQNLNTIESLEIEIIAIEQDYLSSQFNRLNPQDFKKELSQLLQELTTRKRSNALKKGHAKNRINTLPPPGKAPYGYRRGQDKYIIDRSTAPIIKAFFDQFLLFGSLRGAVKFIDQKYGKKISVSTGKQWLTNPVYRGDLAYQNHDIIANTHAPILSREEAAQIDRLLRQNCQFSTRTASAPRSLAGLVFCQNCQSKMTITRVITKNKQQKYLYLRPTHCPLTPKCKGIHYDLFLEKTIEKICQDLPQKVEKLKLPDLNLIKAHLNTAITQKQQTIQTIKDLEKQGILDEKTSQLRCYNLRTEIAQLTSQLDQLPPDNLTSITKAVSLAAFWQDLSEEERRFYFREFIQRIEIIRFDLDPNYFKLRLIFVF